MAADLPSRIQHARKRIMESVRDQCVNGAQSKALPDTAMACGQCIGANARRREQRGLHGTAAALRVLAQAPDEQDRVVLEKLVYYVRNRVDLEVTRLSNTAQADTTRTKCELDSSNVIKVSELLYSLSLVPGDVPGRSELIATLSGILDQAKIDDRGWSYFTKGVDTEVELLPTAYAVLGLRRNGLRIEGPARYLFNHLNSRAISTYSRMDSDVVIDVACLYAVVFSERPNGRMNEQHYRKMLTCVWRPLYALLQSDTEQNIEYWSQDDAFFVRIPWQLYLLALSAELDFVWKFRTMRASRCLDRALHQTSNGGFIYPHSSREVSARTSALLFDSLGHIERNCDADRLKLSIKLVDRINDLMERMQVLLGSPWIRGAVCLGTCGIGLYAIMAWLYGGGTLADLGPELVGALFGLMFIFGARRTP